MALRAIDWRTIAAFSPGDARRQRRGVTTPRRSASRHRADSFAVALGGVRALIADAAFRRTVVMVSASQCAAMSLGTLWIATWLRESRL